ncbi:hypothetical protein BX070DRAFT_18179 [Coemansia spiralis]|nr:hypothetical protein BX070DRAFT_18179 [Coemansia spiralis]
MADAALSASGMSDRHREHLPKQQPQQPLRPSMAAASHTNSTSENGNKSYGTSNQPVPNKVENQGQPPHRIRPLSFNAAGRDYGSALPSLGPHPGPNPLTRVNSAGGGGGHSDAFERHHPPHTQASSRLQPQAAYLQQRATGTTNEHVFNAHDSVAAPTSGGSGGAPASVPAPVAPSNLPVKAAVGTGHDVRHGAAGQPYRSSGINSSNSSSNSRRMVGPYQLAKTIGAGSMGKVKVALDTRTNKRSIVLVYH